LLKGFLSNIDSFTHLRLSWALGGALFFQLVGIYLMPVEAYGGFVTVALAGSYTLLLAGLTANLRILGFKVLFAGATLNFLVIAFNGWRMPVSPEALTKAGFLHDAALAPGAQLPDPKNVLLLQDNTNLALFSDIIPSTFPIQSVWSIGDLLIAIGLALVLVRLGKIFFSNAEQSRLTSPSPSSNGVLSLETLSPRHQSREVKL
jgi:hypothetical protein